MHFKTGIILFILLLNIYSAAQVINVPGNRGARNAALGDALISECKDVSSVYLNPASLSYIKESTLFFNHGQLQKNLGMTENFAVPVIRFTQLSVSLGLSSYHLGYIEEKSAFPNQNIFEYGYNITASTNAIAQTLSVGASFGFRRGKTDHSRKWSSNYSIGLNYSPSADINYGLVFSGLGDELTYSPIDTALLVSKQNSKKRLVVGGSMKYPSTSSLRQTIFVLALANEKVFGTDGLFYKAGIEFRPIDFLNLRFGYVYGPDVSEPRIGAGVHFNIVTFDYVYYAGPSPVMLQQFSLSIKI